MSEKCICNINGHPIKDSTARKSIEEINKKIENIDSGNSPDLTEINQKLAKINAIKSEVRYPYLPEFEIGNEFEKMLSLTDITSELLLHYSNTDCTLNEIFLRYRHVIAYLLLRTNLIDTSHSLLYDFAHEEVCKKISVSLAVSTNEVTLLDNYFIKNDKTYKITIVSDKTVQLVTYLDNNKKSTLNPTNFFEFIVRKNNVNADSFSKRNITYDTNDESSSISLLETKSIPSFNKITCINKVEEVNKVNVIYTILD